MGFKLVRGRGWLWLLWKALVIGNIESLGARSR